MKLTIVIREANVKDRVRLSKIITYLKETRKLEFELWKKEGNEDLDFLVKDLIKSNKNKKIEYIKWLLKLTWYAFTAKNRLFFVSGFESALVIYFRSLIFKTKYIFDNPDNFYQSKQLPKRIESWVIALERRVIKKSVFTLVPDQKRIQGYDLDTNKFEVLKNFPSKDDIERAKAIEHGKSKKLIIYINGWLVPTRGLEMILGVLKKMPKGLDIEVIIAGKKEGLGEILNSEYVSYKGVISAIESLSFYNISDVILSFYDPSIEINRKASPNKWGDAILTETVPILNYGIETTKDYFPNGGYFQVTYNSVSELYNLLMEIYEDKTILAEKIVELQSNPKFYWEDQLDRIFKKIKC